MGKPANVLGADDPCSSPSQDASAAKILEPFRRQLVIAHVYSMFLCHIQAGIARVSFPVFAKAETQAWRGICRWIGNTIPAHLARRANFRRGHGGRSRHMDGRRSNSLFERADWFGFDRVMFGGDWPVSELSAKLVITASASLNQRRRLYCDTAISFYGL